MVPERGASDWALCVGIGHYVAEARLEPLPGAREDAARFHAWLIATDGGAVPEAQCQLLVSPVPQSGTSPAPLVDDIEHWFKKLFRIARENERAGRGARIGRRLYLYLSGHGVALGSAREAVLLTADSEPPISCEHVAGRIWADWFRARGVFDEVMLVMDCCRSGVRSVHVNGPPWQILEAREPARPFYAFAATHGATAREVEIDGEPAGLFTSTMLRFLEDPALRPLTASRLKGLLYQALSGPHEPVIEMSPSPADDFEIVAARAVGPALDGERELIALFDDDPGAPAPRVAPAVVLSGGTAVPLSGVAGLGAPGAARPGPRQLVIEAERVSAADLGRILAATQPASAVLYSERRPPGRDERIHHVVAHDTDSPALALLRTLAALERVPVASLQVVASDRWAKVLVWNAGGELLAEGPEEVFLEGLPRGRYRVRASLGSTCWDTEHELAGDDRVDVPPLALDTAAPVEGSSRWTADDRAQLARLDATAPVVVVHRGLAAPGPRAPGAELAAPVAAGSWTAMGCATSAARLVIEAPLGARRLALAVPVRRDHRTEVYIDGADGDRRPDVAIRVVPAGTAVGAAAPTDRARESLRLAMIHDGPVPPPSFAGLERDPVAALLAAASAPDAPGVSRLVDSAAVVLGDADEDVVAWRGDGGLASPPLLAASWARLAAGGADVAAGSLADQLAGRRVALAPWLAWDAEATGREAGWLRAVAGAMWPAWDRDPQAAQALVELAAAGRTLGAPSGSATRQAYKAPPVERLVRHEAVAFVGATNDQLAAALAIAFVERRRRPWRELTLWFLDARLEQLQSDRRTGAAIQRARGRAEAELVRLLPLVAERWRVLRYAGFDIRGVWHFASLWDWREPHGFVHVSPYRPHDDVRTSSRLDLERPSSPDRDCPYGTAVEAYEQLRPTAVVAESPTQR